MELAFTGGFAWAAWQVIGKLQKHVARVEKNIDDGRLLGDWDRECKAQVAKKQRASAAMGKGATASAHDHIFEDWRNKKLRPAQITQLATDLAELAQWAGAGSWVPELRGDLPVKPWAEQGAAGKVHLLQAADALEFNFADVVKRQAQDLAGNWLWQVTEALPALSAEPVRSAAPAERLADLKTRLTEAETSVRAAFDSERRSQAASLKGLVQPLAVAQCMRKIQMLKVLLEEVGLTAAGAAAAAERIRSELKAPLTLAAAEGEVAAQKAAAVEAVEAEADTVVAAEREARTAQIDAAAEATYRRALTLQAASPTHWHASSTTPALHRLGLLAALLGELTSSDTAGTETGAAAAADLADAIRKLTPQMRVQLSDEEKAKQAELLGALTPAPPPPPSPPPTKAEPAAEESKEGEESAEEEAGAEAAETEAPPPPPARPAPGAAAAELRRLLEGAIRTHLAQSRAERKAARAAELEAARAAKAAAKAAAAAAAEAAKAEAESGAAAAAEAAKVEAEAEAAVAAPTPDAAEAPAEEMQAEEKATEDIDGAAEAAEAEAKVEKEEEAPAEAVPEPAAEEKAEAVSEPAAEEKAEAVSEPAAEEKALAVPEPEAERKPQEVAPPQEPEEEEEDAEAEEEVEEEPPTAEESVDVEAVKQGVEVEARARADAEKESAVLKLQDALAALRASTVVKAMKALVAKVAAAAADDAAGALDAGARLLAVESAFRDAAAAPTDAALAAAVTDAASKLTAADRAALDLASAAAVSRLEAAASVVKLTADAAKLDMGPGCSDVLRRTDAWLAAQQEALAAVAQRAAARAAKAVAKAEAAAAAAKAAAEAEAAAAAAAEAAAAAADVEAEASPSEAAAAAEEAVAEQPEEGGKAEAEPADSEEKPEEAGTTANPARLAEGRQLVSELLAEGLVLLELPGPSNKKLQLLRESVDALSPVDGDGVMQNRIITALKEVVGQLGPIGGSVDARVSQVVDEVEREKLLQVRANAMAIYSALTAFLRLETDTLEAAKTDLEQAKKAVYGMKIERRAESLAAAMDSCGGVSERCASLARAVLGLGSPAGKEAAMPAKAALQATAEQAQVLSASVNDYISYVRLREHALGVPITAKAELDEDCEMSLPTLDEMTSRHGDEAVWLDLAGLGLPQLPEDEGDGEGGNGAEGEEGEREEAQAAQEKAVEELQQRLNDWHTAGLRLLARGQAALVTLGGLTVDGSASGELRMTADLGLPSAKSLLQLGAEKLARLQLLAAESVSGPNSGVAYPLHWFLLVTPAAVEPLKAFLQDNGHFGLLPSQVHVYGNQVRPPLMNEDLKVVLDSTGSRTARSQPGSGEVFLALRRCGALAQLRRLGVRCLEVNAVEDNLLGRTLDPAFLGACAATAIDSAAKVAVPGVQTEGPSALPEVYSRYLELLGGSSPLLASLGDAVPALGSYYFSMDFVRRVEKLLREQPLAMYRLAPADKVPTRGSAVAAAAFKPAAGAAAAATPAPGGGAVGYRLERRLSDFASPAIGRLLGGSVHLAMVAVDAGTEFAPVWGAAPWYRTSSAKAAVDALLLQHTRWVEDSGAAMADEEGVVEVSPLVSYAGEGLAPLVEGKTFEEAYVLELQGFAPESTGTASNVGLWAVPAIVLYGGVAAAKLLAKATHK